MTTKRLDRTPKKSPTAGMDALALVNLLADGKPRTHAEMVIASGLTGARMRGAICLLARDGLIVSDPFTICIGSERGKSGSDHPMARRATGFASVQCWRAPLAG